MVAVHLVRLIESNSTRLAARLLETFQSSPRLPGLRKVPADELAERAHEVYRNLSQWLLGSTDAEIERRYVELGTRRASQGVPFSEFLWALLATKENLFEFLQREGIVESSAEMFGELELVRQLDRFFDRALYYAAVGYEAERAARAA